MIYLAHKLFKCVKHDMLLTWNMHVTCLLFACYFCYMRCACYPYYDLHTTCMHFVPWCALHKYNIHVTGMFGSTCLHVSAYYMHWDFLQGWYLVSCSEMNDTCGGRHYTYKYKATKVRRGNSDSRVIATNCISNGCFSYDIGGNQTFAVT